MALTSFTLDTTFEDNDNWKLEDSMSYAYDLEDCTWTADGDTFETTTSYFVHFKHLKQFCDELLGSTKLTDSNKGLTRDLPERHPLFREAVAVKLTGIGFGLDEDKLENLDPQYEIPTGGNAEYLSLQVAKINVLFKTTDYDMLVDDDVIFNEEERFCIRDYKTITEYVSGPNNLQFCSGNNGTAGQSLQAGVGKLSNTKSIIVTMIDVPCDPQDRYKPANWRLLDACVGHVNSTMYLGEAAGTMLIEDWYPNRKKPNLLNSNVYMDVVCIIKRRNNCVGINGWDGTSGTNGVIASPDYNNEDDWAGHNYYPNVFLGNNFRWDLLTVKGQKGNTRVFPKKEFNYIFDFTKEVSDL